jgi:hypothetical protein
MSRELISGEIVHGSDYDNENYKQFCDDMNRAGFDCEHYNGRFFYEGPSVTVDDISYAMSATSVRCDWDGMGLGYVVYPKG